MFEGQPLPDLSLIPEIYPQSNQYYQAVAENQMMWRDATRSSFRTHEMPRMSYNIEGNMKRVFSDYIDPSFPRLLIAWSFLLDTPSEEVPYHRLTARYPEHIREEDREDYGTGMYHLNEWATMLSLDMSYPLLSVKVSQSRAGQDLCLFKKDTLYFSWSLAFIVIELLCKRTSLVTWENNEKLPSNGP